MKTDLPELRLSKYELLRPLGAGGMGVVYLARDTVLNREVAIKFVSPERLTDPGAERRLVREARAVAALDHACICPVYDVDVDAQGRTCIVMQYVEGETLSRRLNRGPMDAREVLAFVADVAEALVVAHARGIVHRDLKPQNIIVTPSGRPKLLDFGIAQTQLPAEVVASAITRTGTAEISSDAIVGTPAYMSPEQILRNPMDGRSDLFSLGAILFECLTGQPAFQAASNVETWARVLHTDPPAPSSVVPGLLPAHDELCRKLLQKQPADRFGSAGELLAAVRALSPGTPSETPAGFHPRTVRLAAAAAALLVVAAFIAWRVSRPRLLPPAPAEAQVWYDRGTEHIRNAAYYSAQQALNEALRVHPAYPQAYARLAEVESELDEERGAQKALLQASALVTNPAQLSADDSGRLAAIRAVVLRDLPRALQEYQRIADAHPSDRGAWLDLGRTRQAAGLRADARAAYVKALQTDSQYAAAHLRLGTLAAQEARRDEALKEFQEAERLYRAASDVEGQTEALLERALLFNGLGELPNAREALNSAAVLAQQTGNRFQQIRSELLMSSLIGSEGHFEKARTVAETAVTAALKNGLDTLAANGMIELGSALLRAKQWDPARNELQAGIDLAKRSGSPRIAAIGTLQLASLFNSRQQPKDALALIGGVLDFFKQGQFRRYELVALSLMSTAHLDLGDFARARGLAEEVLRVAEGLNDDSEVALALETLAGLDASSGALPDALRLRERLEEIHRRQQDRAQLAYDLPSRAELLIKLGRLDAAEAPLREVDAGIAAGVQAFVARGRKITLLRAMIDTEQLRFASAEARCLQVRADSRALVAPDSTSVLAETLLAHARARLGRRVVDRGDLSAPARGSLAQRSELSYWRAATWLLRGDARTALTEVEAALTALERGPSSEHEWRLAAVGAAAARRLRDPARAGALAARARTALARLRAEWKDAAADYDKRPDLIERRRDADPGQPM